MSKKIEYKNYNRLFLNLLGLESMYVFLHKRDFSKIASKKHKSYFFQILCIVTNSNKKYLKIIKIKEKTYTCFLILHFT